MGFEHMPLLDRRSKQLSYGALHLITKFILLAIVFTRAAPAFEDLFNTCIWLLLDTNTVHTTAKEETFEYLLKLTSM